MDARNNERSIQVKAKKCHILRIVQMLTCTVSVVGSQVREMWPTWKPLIMGMRGGGRVEERRRNGFISQGQESGSWHWQDSQCYI